MSEFVYTCKTCKRAEPECICGKKRDYFRCVICEGDVPIDKAVWTGEPNISEPAHHLCFAALQQAEGAAEILTDEQDGEVRQLQDVVEIPANTLVRLVQIPMKLMIQVPVTVEECDQRVKHAVSDMLSNVILAYQEATFSMDPMTGEVEVKNLRLGEILQAAGEQERHRKDRREAENRKILETATDREPS